MKNTIKNWAGCLVFFALVLAAMAALAIFTEKNKPKPKTEKECYEIAMHSCNNAVKYIISAETDCTEYRIDKLRDAGNALTEAIIYLGESGVGKDNIERLEWVQNGIIDEECEASKNYGHLQVVDYSIYVREIRGVMRRAKYTIK